MGIKIIVIAVVCVWFQNQSITLLQWLGILLCSFAAIGMNFTGGLITWKGVLFLATTLIFYVMSDIFTTELTKIVRSENPVFASVCGTAASYVVMGILSTVFLFRIKRSVALMTATVPYAFCWYGAMLFLFFCFSTVGVVYGTIIQATRGIISVIMGAFLLKMGHEELEPRVPTSAWIRRLIMSVLMLVAMTLYSYAKK